MLARAVSPGAAGAAAAAAATVAATAVAAAAVAAGATRGERDACAHAEDVAAVVVRNSVRSIARAAPRRVALGWAATAAPSESVLPRAPLGAAARAGDRRGVPARWGLPLRLHSPEARPLAPP
eukprot:TRINITY_DN7014_c0_g1_i2.p5 TRINITY_DN7014_c0_g1~~TRINITY_DN7014_c0_g1_i2.p5  ORF type:complete len:123 (+),score=27.12 TRINITY_DN7014_c0_g1_i2:990-1358(+)